MTLIVDAAPLVAAADRCDRLAVAVQRILADEPGPLLVPAPVTAEVDYLLGRRLGERSRHAFLEDLAAGRFTIGCPTPEEYTASARLDRQYRDLRLGLADASIVVLAARSNTTRLLTFDERHFRVVSPLGGGSFTLLPADARA